MKDELRLVDGDDPMLRVESVDYLESELTDARSTASDMFRVLDMTGGIGLAAPQIGISKSLFVISIDGVRRVFINPAVIGIGQSVSTEPEGCLSLPGLQLMITRPTDVTVSWMDEQGTRQIADLTGLWARCWLHEYDHIKGILIDDRVSRLQLDIAKRKMAKKARFNRRQKA